MACSLESCIQMIRLAVYLASHKFYVYNINFIIDYCILISCGPATSRSRQDLHRDQPPPLAGVRRVSRQGVPGGTLPRVPGRGRCAGRHAAPMPVPGRSAPRLLGSINVTTKQLQDDGVVAALAQASGATRNR